MRFRVWPWRRTVQLGVIAVTLALPVVARYSHYLAARDVDDLSEKWEGTLQGALLEGSDAVMRVGIPDGEGGVAERRPRKAILARAEGFSGSPWSAQIFGVSLTDPMAAAESALASRRVRKVLLVGAAIPVLLTVLLGRVFCGWICPMGFFFDMAAKVRSFLERALELPTLDVRVSPYGKYFVLAIGFVFTLAFGLPILHYIYPPALFGAEAHGMVNALFDRAELGTLGFAWVGLTSASLFMLGLLLIEIFIAPRFFCRSVCPGGALYSMLGRFRVVRVRREVSGCTHCTLCDHHCPRGLLPMVDRIGPECDNCGVCIDVCAPGVLAYKLSLTDEGYTKPSPSEHEPGDEPPTQEKRPEKIESKSGVGVAAMSLLVLTWIAFTGSFSASAHHVLGVPHYAYDESYPQAPVMKLQQVLGPWELQMTSYPGSPVAGERTQVHAYMVDTASKRPYEKTMTIQVQRVGWRGRKEVVYGPATSELDENVFKFFFTYPKDGNYEIELHFDGGPEATGVAWPVTVGEASSPWAAIGWSVGGISFLLLLIRAIRIKLARAKAESGGKLEKEATA